MNIGASPSPLQGERILEFPQFYLKGGSHHEEHEEILG
jgi:hypothetical protein